MPVSIFLCHNIADKPFVRRLARDLENQGLTYWLDEAEIKVGESLIEKIREGIDRIDYVAVVLSPASVASPWVKREVDVAMNQEISGRRVKVLPLMYRQCDPPGFLLGKLYADFTEDGNYQKALADLVQSVGLVFNRAAFTAPGEVSNLGVALDKAWSSSLRVLGKPFHRPFLYVGMLVQDAARQVGVNPNEVGNIIVESADAEMLLEAEGSVVSYVDIVVKGTGPHVQTEEFDSEVVLGALSISPAELELARRSSHCHTYYDHGKKLKINVACIYDGAPLSVGFSRKYYGM